MLRFAFRPTLTRGSLSFLLLSFLLLRFFLFPLSFRTLSHLAALGLIQVLSLCRRGERLDLYPSLGRVDGVGACGWDGGGLGVEGFLVVF